MLKILGRIGTVFVIVVIAGLIWTLTNSVSIQVKPSELVATFDTVVAHGVSIKQSTYSNGNATWRVTNGSTDTVSVSWLIETPYGEDLQAVWSMAPYDTREHIMEKGVQDRLYIRKGFGTTDEWYVALPPS
ncbi:MAG: hypothetical protein WC451_04725 [Patescibacteria group bacterium]|jgi:hypothetical protein